MSKMSVWGRIVRLVIIIASAGMIWWYADSIIINIGSVTGTLFFTAAGLCAAFWPKLLSVLRKLRKNKKARYITNALFGIMGAVGLYILVVLCLMLSYSMRPAAEDATVVVLGCQVNGDRPSLMLSRRIGAAAGYLKEHPHARCIVSGGQGNHENISEAQCMYSELVAKGISPDRIFMEDKSTNTDENIRFSGDIIEKEGLSRELAIVTDGFHQFRASMTAEKYGFHSGAVSADTPGFLLANFTTRELLAITAGFIFP